MTEINRSDGTSLTKEIKQLLQPHLRSPDSPDVLENLAQEIEQLFYQHLHSPDVVKHLAQEIEPFLYHRLRYERERRGRSVDFFV